MESQDTTAEDSPEIARLIAAGEEVNRFRQRFIFYMRPTSVVEDELRAEIDRLASVRVKAGDNAALAAQGFRTGECHRNCIAATARGLGEHLFGWTVSDDAYLSHSVLRMPDGSLCCITPDHTDELDPDGCFEFREDRAFTFDGTWMRRNGEFLRQPESVVRKGDPEAVRCHYAALEDRLQRGELKFDDVLGQRLTTIPPGTC